MRRVFIVSLVLAVAMGLGYALAGESDSLALSGIGKSTVQQIRHSGMNLRDGLVKPATRQQKIMLAKRRPLQWGGDGGGEPTLPR